MKILARLFPQSVEYGTSFARFLLRRPCWTGSSSEKSSKKERIMAINQRRSDTGSTGSDVGRTDVDRDLDRDRTRNPDANPDPITGPPASHPIATAIGAAGPCPAPPPPGPP